MQVATITIGAALAAGVSGSCNISVPIAAGSMSSSVQATFWVPPSGNAAQMVFSGPVTSAVPQNGSWTFPLTITPLAGLTGSNFTLSAIAPSGLTVTVPSFTFSLDGTDPFTEQITVSASPSLAQGTYEIGFTANGPGQYANYSVFVTITSATVSDFEVSPAQGESVHAGGSVSFTSAATPINAFTGPVALTSPGATGGVGLSFAPGTVTLNGGPQSSTGTLTTLSSTPAGSYSVPILATSNGVTHTSYVTLSVPAGNGSPPLTVTSSATPNPAPLGQKIAFSVAVAGGKAPYTYQWSGLAASTAQSFSFQTTAAGSFTETVVVKDANNTTATSAIAVRVNPALAVTTSSSNNPATAGVGFTMSATASGGTPPYTYAWTRPENLIFASIVLG